jgi:hypothetical protein
MQRTNAILTLSGIPDDNKRKRIFDLVGPQLRDGVVDG